MTAVTVYVLSSILWAVLGLVVGFFLGRAGRVPAPLPEVSVTSPPPPLDPDAVEVEGVELVSVSRRPSWEQVLGFVVVILAVASVAVMAVTLTNQQAAIDQQQASVECQAKFNRAFAVSSTEAREAAATERAAQRDLLTAILTPGKTRAEGRQAIQDYLASLAAADAQRSAAPYPDEPSCAAPSPS